MIVQEDLENENKPAYSQSILAHKPSVCCEKDSCIYNKSVYMAFAKKVSSAF